MKRPPGLEKLERAQRLRREMTPQEKILWSHLRDRRFEGFKFRRQMWLAGYIADFACPEARLVVEADGSQHSDQPAYDEARGAAFAGLGWKTVRFWNDEINVELEGVLAAIAAHLPPLPAGEREGLVRRSGAEVDGRVRADPPTAHPLTRLRSASPPSPLQGEG